MSAPRTKRQFAGAASDPAQRQITSFFTSTGTASASPNNSNYISQPSPLPSTAQRLDNTQLPAYVQTNLLSVGMRIRKSVPEGYKTGNYNAFALWDESDTGSTTSTSTMGEGQRSRANAFSSPRELLPFCGIHRVGGLDIQSGDDRPTPSTFRLPAGTSGTPAYNPIFGVNGTDIDGMPGLTSSQESVESNASSITLPPPPGVSGAGTRKRFFVEDDDDQISGQLNLWRYNSNISLSPLSNNGRPMAVPRKGRLRAKFSGTATEMSGAGQENLMVVDSDFGEAEFLDQATWEVDMNDA